VRTLLAVLLLGATIAPVAAATRPAPASPPRILSTTAVAGPTATETRLGWLEQPAGTNCGHVAVRDLETLRRHDLGNRVCFGDREFRPDRFAWGEGVGLLTDTFGGNTTYETVSVVGPRKEMWGMPDGQDNVEAEPAYISDWAGGSAVEAAAGSDASLLYSVVSRGTRDPECDDKPDGDCSLVVHGGRLWSFQHGHWRKVAAPWPVGSLGASGHSVALAQAEGPGVDVRDLRTWQPERRFSLPGVRAVALAPHLLAARTATAIYLYARPGGRLILKRALPETSGNPFYTEPDPPLIAVSESAVAYRAEHGASESIAVVRRNGTTSWVGIEVAIDELALSGRRLAWRADATIRTVLLPRT
jgi:hypothetical protein